MAILFTTNGWSDYLYWQEADAQIFSRIGALLRDCQRSPYAGIGKPQRLTGDFEGFWSRRIDRQNRLVYRVSEGQIAVLQCRFHH